MGMNHAIHGIVLAGGRSSRMGTDKALLPVGGVPLIRHICDSLAPLCRDIIVVVGSLHHNPYRALLDERTRFAEDRYPGSGPLAGLHAGLLHAADGYGFLVACDMPCVSPALFTQMAEKADGYQAVLCREQPFHALYHVNAADAAEAHLRDGRFKLLPFAESLRHRYVAAEDDSCFLNLNNPEEYERFMAGTKNSF
jgi:molybdopterin-guanine dinucleotide biosynthesis protein A